MLNRKSLKILFLTVFISSGFIFKKSSEYNFNKTVKNRPSEDEYFFDYANILEDKKEYANRYLEGIRKNHFIEVMIVTVPFLEKKRTIEETALMFLNNWKIGKDFGGKGVLLIFSEKEKLAKLEISYELEDVFTDGFCGYIEDVQLKPYFLSGQLGIGLLAVMEEIENRAYIKREGNFTPNLIAELDKRLISGGAGARRDLSKFKKEIVNNAGSKYPPGKTPAEAWQTMIKSWQDKVRDPELGVYTEAAKLAFRDYQNSPDNRFEEEIRKYAGKPYEVKQNEKYAIIYFGNKSGWDNAPKLFCKTKEGWKYDLASQRRYVRMGPSPDWGIERTINPYIDLLSSCPYYMGLDIPLEKGDTYRIEDDEFIAQNIKFLEPLYKDNPNDFNIALELGKLNMLSSMRPKDVFPILKRAKELNPQNPIPYKYLAIAYVESSYEYNNAILELKEYIKREPDNVFGHNFLGYLYFCTGDYKSAIDEFNKVLALESDNCYSYCKLSRSYGMLYLNGSKLDLRQNQNKKFVLEMFNNAKNVKNPDGLRIWWLECWLQKNGFLDNK